MTDFQEILNGIRKLRAEYNKREKKNWTPEAVTLELQKQLGELSKFIMSQEGYYIAARDKMENYQATKDKIGDELWDLLFSIVRLADYYNIDLEEAHKKQIKLAYRWFKENEK